MHFVKVKKKKKSKTESKENAELRMSIAAGGLEPAPESDQSLETTEEDALRNLVGMSNVKPVSVASSSMWVASWY